MRSQEILIAERLGEKLNGPRLHLRHVHRDVAVTADKDYRKLNARTSQLPLEFEPAPSRQSDIEHYAAGHIGTLAAQELQGRPTRLCRMTDRSNQNLNGFANVTRCPPDNDDR